MRGSGTYKAWPRGDLSQKINCERFCFMKYLKLTILLAVVSGILLCFAGCDKGNSVKNPESTVLNNTPVVTDVPATDEPYEPGFELHFIDVGPGDCMLLVADDEALIRRLVCDFLKNSGISICRAKKLK